MQSANANWTPDTNQEASPHLTPAAPVNSNILTPQILPPQSQEIMREIAVWSLVSGTLDCCLV